MSVLNKAATALDLASSATAGEVLAAIKALKEAPARTAARHSAAILTRNDVTVIAGALGLPSTASKDALVAAIRKLDAAKDNDANALRLIALTLGLASESTRDQVLAEIQTWAPPASRASDLITHRARYLVEHSEGKLTFGAALHEAAREFPYAATSAAGEHAGRRAEAYRAIEQRGEPATTELITLVSERMTSKRLTFQAALLDVGRERPELVTAADNERARREIAS